MSGVCAGCKHWERKDDISGECHVIPKRPVVDHISIGVDKIHWLFPSMYAEDWCGQWEAAPIAVPFDPVKHKDVPPWGAPIKTEIITEMP